ncbi:unnamed protein product [Pleuronectes platessa]|uniref:Uncharacterized protein n=1 Tax=Pleuronectes platessa TaxID=8262 RepID=A0A9N7V217_PLEPL|nr:unnamed protein product [Pleuronectes platessa]
MPKGGWAVIARRNFTQLASCHGRQGGREKSEMREGWKGKGIRDIVLEQTDSQDWHREVWPRNTDEPSESCALLSWATVLVVIMLLQRHGFLKRRAVWRIFKFQACTVGGNKTWGALDKVLIEEAMLNLCVFLGSESREICQWLRCRMAEGLIQMSARRLGLSDRPVGGNQSRAEDYASTVINHLPVAVVLANPPRPRAPGFIRGDEV